MRYIKILIVLLFYCPLLAQNTISTKLVILGGDDAGLGAVWAAGELGIETVLVLTHPRDFGGDFTNFIPTDIAVSARTVGGINYVYDTFARKHTNEKSGSSTAGKDGRVAPPGASIEFLYDLVKKYPHIKILTGYLPKPHSGVRNKKNQVKQVSVIAEDGQVIKINCQFAIDGTPEGYGAKAFDLPVVFGREGQHEDKDPTRDMEAFAGRRLFATYRNNYNILSGKVPLLEKYCDRRPEIKDNSMAASPVIPLKEYVLKSESVPDDAPWLLKNEPTGFDINNFKHLKDEKRPGGNRNGRNIWRFSGNEPLKSLPEWYRLPDGTHYLRHDDVWKWKRYVEKKAFQYVVNSLYYYQKFTPEGNRYGIDKDAFNIYDAPYKLSDFGTTSYGGDQYFACRLYHRVLARLKVPEPVGGQMFFRKGGRPYFHEKSFWVFDGIGVPLLEIDYHSVLAASVPSPDGAGPEGSAFTYCVPEASGLNLHSLPRRIIEPDYSLIDNYLSPGTPSTTFMAQSSIRAGSSMNHLGVVAAAMVYLADKQQISVSGVNTLELQWLLVDRLNSSIVYFENAIAGTPEFKYEQMAGVLGIPFKNLNDSWDQPFISDLQLRNYVKQYALFKKQDVPDFEIQQGKMRCKDFFKAFAPLLHPKIKLYICENDEQFIHLQDIRQILTRDMIADFTEIGPYIVPNRIVFDSFNRKPGEIGSLETGDEWNNRHFEIYRGHAVSQSIDEKALLLTNGTNKDFELSVEICLEQKPLDWPNGQIHECGLLLDYKNDNDYMFFGITDDRDELKFGLVDQQIRKEKIIKYSISSFSLKIIKNGNNFKFFVNDRLLFTHTIEKEYAPAIGLIHGTGEGRVHFQNFSQITTQ